MSRRRQPVVFRWCRVEVVDAQSGEVSRAMAMVPSQKYRNAAARQFGEEGGEFAMEIIVDRDMRSHNAFFAEMSDLFESVPEDLGYMKDPKTGKFMLDDHEQRILRWPTAEHFRKWILIETGWHDEKEFECSNRDHARRLGAFIRTEDDYSRISIRGNLVIVKKARSQSLAEMGATDFEASKRDVLDLARAMLGVTAVESRRSAGRSA